MASKRIRHETAAAASAAASPAPSLVTEVYDTLMQASRKELAQLLSVFVKASSANVLEKVRSEAAKSGALVATTSRWQQCSHTMLDSFFSLLDKPDLRTGTQSANAGTPRAKTATPAGSLRCLASRVLTSDGLANSNCVASALRS